MQNGTTELTERSARYSVAEVAEHLGITARAVRKRIATGRLAAVRRPHGWAVALDAAPAEPTAEPGPAPTEPPPAPAAPTEPLTEPTAELAALRAQVAWLQAEIERRDTAESELRRL